MAKKENPYNADSVCRYCSGNTMSYCAVNGGCEDYDQERDKETAWDEGYDDCANQPISEQEGWQTGEPSKEEGPFLLDLGDHQYRLADMYISATPGREPAFKNTCRVVFPYTFSKYVKRWKRI